MSTRRNKTNQQCVIEGCENPGKRDCNKFCSSQVCSFHYMRSIYCGNCSDNENESESSENHSNAIESNENHSNANLSNEDHSAENESSENQSNENLPNEDHSAENESNGNHFNFVIHDRWRVKMGSHDPISILSELLALYETTAVDREIIHIMLGSDLENQYEKAKTLGLDRKNLRQKFIKIEDQLDDIISKY